MNIGFIRGLGFFRVLQGLGSRLGGSSSRFAASGFRRRVEGVVITHTMGHRFHCSSFLWLISRNPIK